MQSFNHSYNLIQSFKYSIFHSTVLKPRGHGTIFTCDCKKIFKKTYLLLSYEKKLYFGNFYRAFKKVEQLCSYNAYISHINAFWIWSCWGIHKSLLLGKSIFAFEQLVNSLQVGAIAFSHLLIIEDSGTELPVWVWKSTETKLMTLKVFWDLYKTS